MIIVCGEAHIADGQQAAALALSQEHVARSRLEPGCITHDVLLDPDNPSRLVFVERWDSGAALRAHFAVPASRAFVKSLSALLSAPPQMSIFEASALPPQALA